MKVRVQSYDLEQGKSWPPPTGGSRDAETRECSDRLKEEMLNVGCLGQEQTQSYEEGDDSPDRKQTFLDC
jgi:hypothetical protein